MINNNYNNYFIYDNNFVSGVNDMNLASLISLLQWTSVIQIESNHKYKHNDYFNGRMSVIASMFVDRFTIHCVKESDFNYSTIQLLVFVRPNLSSESSLVQKNIC